MDWIYDLETYPNCFTCSIVDINGENEQVFECSTRKNEAEQLFNFLDACHKKKSYLIGFNNLGFDYPVLHDLLSVREKALTVSGKAVAVRAYKKAQALIESQDKFGNLVPDRQQYVKQIDLYKIHHFDNKARATSLKMLEFNMKADNIEDLPFPVGHMLSDDEMDTLISYNMHDARMTLAFYNKSLNLINFRKELTVKYKRNFLNHNDTKIGKDYFIMQLEESMPESCYIVGKRGERKINQTKRDVIHIKDCLFNYYDFQRQDFQLVLEWFKKQTITETKGVFSEIEEHELGDLAAYAELLEKNKKFKAEPTEEEIAKFKEEHPLGWIEKTELKAKKKGVTQYSYWGCWNIAATLNVKAGDFRFDFGTGGIHGSVESQIVTADETHCIIDADVSSMYPNIAIANRVYPEHLSDKFCDIYQDVYNQRKSYAKNTAENAMLKLALNGVYGDSNNKFSPFYDPQYTMSITINGQLSILLLAEKLLNIEGLSIVQVNTDGITVKLPHHKVTEYESICAAWQKQVGLELEFAHYSKMIIRDVNNYIALYTDGKIKRKGVYQYEGLGWHQDQGGLVIPKAAEAHMLHGVDIAKFIRSHDNDYDFLMRTKVPRSSRLVMVMEDGTELQQQNICRFYACNAGGELVKIMPPIDGEEQERRISVASGWGVWVCNNIADFTRRDVEYNYYVDAAEKLVITQ
jgi:hypothetical protein